MKKTVLMLAAVCTFTCAMAQSEGRQGGREARQNDRTEIMVKELGLNEQQAEQVKKLNAKYPDLQRRGRGDRGGRGGRGYGRPTMRQPQVDGETGATQQAQERPQRPSREEIEKRMEERRKKQQAYDEELKTILTEEQFAAYKQKQQELENQRRERGRRN